MHAVEPVTAVVAMLFQLEVSSVAFEVVVVVVEDASVCPTALTATTE